MIKVLRLLVGPNRLERILSLLEIRLNHVLYQRACDANSIISFADFTQSNETQERAICSYLLPGKEAEQAVKNVRRHFECEWRQIGDLPFPTFFNADLSFAMLAFALARSLKPQVVIETGVGYGITSSIILQALQKNETGRLVSIDLPSISDSRGHYVGLAVTNDLRKRWQLRRGASRKWLKSTLKDVGEVGLFVSDSANIYTLQRYEFETILPNLKEDGAALFNNIGFEFQQYLNSIANFRTYYIRQIEKTSCVTTLLLKTSSL